MARIVTCRILHGNVQRINEQGTVVGTITTSNAISAVVNGDFITVTKPNRRTELYDANTGALKRIIS